MRFGWLTLAHSPSADEDLAAIEAQLGQACLAEAVGFDGVWLTEHNFTGEAVYCDPIPFAAALAARTERIRIGFAVIQLALRHPVRLAVQLALLDNLSRGRLDVGVGRGSIYNEYEYMGYGLRSDDSRDRAAEALDLLVRAWTEEPLVHEGKYFQARLPALRPRVVQRPHPETRRHMHHAREAYNPSDFQVDPAALNPFTDPSVSEDEGVRWSLETGALCGTAARVTEQLRELEAAGVGHVLCQMSFGYLTHGQITASMRRFGDSVMPAFRR
jgi:alkanesulfonate monooxygenase SsuD/methylene tetrahydromethanopterin reductase-like flavin-dependent oxidoreductase (luciferase family)